MHLLLAEGDPVIGARIRDAMRGESYAVDWVRDGLEADHALESFGYDLLLLDLGLPRKRGMEVLRTLRARGADLPVMLITASDEVAIRVDGLDGGADDLLVMPFDLSELMARIRALLRRRVARTCSRIVHGPLTLDLASHEMTLDGAPVKLSGREFSILRALLDQPGSVVSKSRLGEMLYGWNAGVESNTVDVYVHHLRKKIGTDLIMTVRGVGYKMTAAA